MQVKLRRAWPDQGIRHGELRVRESADAGTLNYRLHIRIHTTIAKQNGITKRHADQPDSSSAPVVRSDPDGHLVHHVRSDAVHRVAKKIDYCPYTPTSRWTTLAQDSRTGAQQTAGRCWYAASALGEHTQRRGEDGRAGSEVDSDDMTSQLVQLCRERPNQFARHRGHDRRATGSGKLAAVFQKMERRAIRIQLS